MLARQLPALVVERVPVAVAGRIAERRHPSVVFDPAHLHVVGNIAPHEIAADAVPRRTFRPLRADMEPLDRRVEDDVAAEARIERDDVGIGIGDRLEPRPVARRRHRRDLLRSLSVCHRTHRRGSYRRCQERSAIHHGSFLRAEIYTRFETDYGVVSRIFVLAWIALALAVPRAAAQDDRFADAVKAAGELPRLHSLLVSRRGELVLERYFNGARATRAANIKSVSKSIISALVGIAIDRGLMPGVETPIAPTSRSSRRTATAASSGSRSRIC